VVMPTAFEGGLVIQENEAGFGGVEGTIDSARAGFTGDGYAAGTGIEWWLDFPAAEAAAFTFRHAGAAERLADLHVNGVKVVSNIEFPATGAWDLVTVHAPVPAGLTRVRLQAVSASGLPDIDFLGIPGEMTTGSTAPLADVYVRGGGSAATNFGTATQLVAKHDAADLNFNRVTYLRLDVSGLADVQTATLKLVPFHVDGATNLIYERIDDDSWSESTMTWNNRPTAAGTTVATVGGYVVGQQIGIDLTSAVRNEADGILSLRVTNDSWNFVGFHSRESATAAFRPVLEDTVAEPTVAAGAVKMAHLRFDETTGATAADSTGNGWNGSLVGSPVWSSGRIDGALSLGGGHVALPASIVNSVDDFTISFWVKPATLSDEARVFDFSDGSQLNRMDFTPRTAAGIARFAITVNGTAQAIEALYAPHFAAGTWTHVTVNLRDDVARLFINGTEIADNAAMTHRPSQLGVTASNLIGTLDGTVDDFRIYKGALGAADVAKLAAPPAPPPSLTATPGNARVTLSWNVSDDATGYLVQRATSSGGPFATLGSVIGPSFVDTAVVNGTTYHYVVTADNGITDGGRSALASATPKAYQENGGRVSMEAENGNLGSRWRVTANGSASNAAVIEVNPIYNNIGTTPDGESGEFVASYAFNVASAGDYRFWFRMFATNADDDSFFWRIDGGNWTMENGRIGSGTWYSVDSTPLDNLAAGSHLLEIVYRENGAGLDKFVIQLDSLAAPSGAGPAETIVPAAPTNLNATAVSPSQVTLTWTAAAGATSYTVMRSTTGGSGHTTIASGVTATGFSDTAVTAGTTYHYVITATNVIGESGASAQASVTPPVPPISPEELMAPAIEISGSNASLTTSTSIVGHRYQLQSSDDLAGEWQNHGEAKAGTGGPLDFIMPIESGSDRRFYRLLIRLP
jgi:hypothetical protein